MLFELLYGDKKVLKSNSLPQPFSIESKSTNGKMFFYRQQFKREMKYPIT